MGGGTTMLPDDLPEDMPSFLSRFGSDEQCREYLFKARWPNGFRCAACGHDDAYALRTKIVYECVACRKQHSLLAGTLFEQTKTGLAKWFLAIYLVTSSKGGIAATELKRQLGFGSCQTAWTWLHKLRKAVVRPAGRRLGREPRRLPRRPCRQAGDRDHRRLARPPRPAGQGLRPRAHHSRRDLGRRRAPAARHPSRLQPRQALAAGHPPRRGGREAPPRLPRRVRVPLQSPHRRADQPRLRPPRRARRAHRAYQLPRSRHSASTSLTVMDRQYF